MPEVTIYIRSQHLGFKGGFGKVGSYLTRELHEPGHKVLNETSIPSMIIAITTVKA